MNDTVSCASLASPSLPQGLEGYLRRVLQRIEDEQRLAKEKGKGSGLVMLGKHQARARYAVRLVRWRVGVIW